MNNYNKKINETIIWKRLIFSCWSVDFPFLSFPFRLSLVFIDPYGEYRKCAQHVCVCVWVVGACLLGVSSINFYWVDVFPSHALFFSVFFRNAQTPTTGELKISSHNFLLLSAWHAFGLSVLFDIINIWIDRMTFGVRKVLFFCFHTKWNQKSGARLIHWAESIYASIAKRRTTFNLLVF